MVFYRKYRPQNFEELVGQDHVKKSLISAFENDKLAHAYLFVGSRGSGKTSTARILAKLVNCEMGGSTEVGGQSKNSPSPEPRALTLPCNSCAACLSITDGSNLDLIEIDAASNRGIDDIRDLREKIKLSPTSLKKKVYIIDEVHMLTTEAFNALLKTLEEPPAHVLFILATTEVSKLPVTILSRVQRFDFKVATNDEIINALTRIVEKEKLKLDPQILNLIAGVSEGSFRDAVKLLDQVSSGGEVSLEEAHKLIAASNSDQIHEFLESLFSKNHLASLNLIADLNSKGTNIKELTNSLLKSLRQILLIKNGLSGDSEKLKTLSGKVSDRDLIKIIENVQESLQQLKYTSIESLPLEVAIIKSASSVMVHESSELPQKQSVVQEYKTNQNTHNSSLITPNLIEPIPTLETMQTSDDVIIIADKWTYILETIRPYNYSLEALLKQAKVVNCDGANVILEVPYSFHQRILEAPKSRTLLESIFADVLGKPIKVSTVLGKRTLKVEELANVEVAADDEIVRLASEIFNS